MHKCPHCGVHALRSIDVRLSRRESPAKCRHCGKLSHVLASTANGIPAIGFVLLALAAVAALALQSWWALAGGVVLVVAHNVWAWRRVELFPISQEAADSAAAVAWWLVAVVFLLKLFSS